MNAVIISCKTIEKELCAAMEQTGCTYPILWLDSGLHNWTEKLRTRLQELLDACGNYDAVLLGMSFCGNSVVGLQTYDFQLVIPRCDDCIDLFMSAPDQRRSVPGTYFLTEGWLAGELNIWKEYQICLEKYGQKRGRRIFQAMLAHYRNLALLDTGCFDCEALEPQVREIADTLNLSYLKLDGTLEYIKDLLGSRWDEDRFVLVPPNSIVTAEMCTRKEKKREC